MDATPIGTGPPSRYTGTSSPSWSTASAAVVAGGRPDLFALDTAIGPTERSSSSATGCSGIRTITVPRVSPRSQANDGACSITRDSPPGQNASTSRRATGLTVAASPSMVAQEPTRTGTGMSGPRPLAASRLRTAAALKASAPMP